MQSEGQLVIACVRHGRTDWNVARRIQGRTDVPLNDAGRQDARRAATRLGRETWHAIYTSPLGRATETAQIIGAHLGLVPISRSCLIERNYGALEGTLVGRRRRRSRRRTKVPGMESDTNLRSRAVACVEGLAQEHPGQKIVIVSHGGFINALLYVLSGGKAGTCITRLANGSISQILRDAAGNWSILTLNETEHLVDPQGPTFRATLPPK